MSHNYFYKSKTCQFHTQFHWNIIGNENLEKWICGHVDTGDPSVRRANLVELEHDSLYVGLLLTMTNVSDKLFWVVYTLTVTHVIWQGLVRRPSISCKLQFNQNSPTRNLLLASKISLLFIYYLSELSDQASDLSNLSTWIRDVENISTRVNSTW